jgi:hypothetical protein
MIEAELLPQYVQFVGVSDKPRPNNNGIELNENPERIPAYLILRNSDDFATYTEKRNVIEAVFIQSTRLSFSSSEDDES